MTLTEIDAEGNFHAEEMEVCERCLNLLRYFWEKAVRQLQEDVSYKRSLDSAENPRYSRKRR